MEQCADYASNQTNVELKRISRLTLLLRSLASNQTNVELKQTSRISEKETRFGF